MIVNVSSLAAIQPFEFKAEYCTAKAARDMFHRVVALENEKKCIKVLNYAPGPLDTEMSKIIRESLTLGEECRKIFQGLKDENKLIPAEISARRLVKIIRTQKFVTGSHIDYYDHVDGIDPALSYFGAEGCSGCGCSSSCGPNCRCAVSVATGNEN